MIRPELKVRLYAWGRWILMIDALAYILALLRTPHIDPTSFEFSAYLWGGMPLCIAALLLLSCGTGKWQTLLVVIDLIGMYLWLSYIGLQIMTH